MLPGQPEEAMDFMPEIRSLDSAHCCFDRVRGGAVLNFASSSAFPSRERDSYDVTPSEVECAPKHVIRPSSSWIYLWRRQRDNVLCSVLVDCCRRIFGIGQLALANVKP